MTNPRLGLIERPLHDHVSQTERSGKNILTLVFLFSGWVLAIAASALPCTQRGRQHLVVQDLSTILAWQHMLPSKTQQLPQLAMTRQSVYSPMVRQSVQKATASNSNNALAIVGAAATTTKGSKASAGIADAAGLSRRSMLAGVAAIGTGTLSRDTAQAYITKESNWPKWRSFPLFPYEQRKTIRRDAGLGVWTFDQLFGILYVHVPIRMTVIAMEVGGLFVYAPAAPTKECLSLLQPLIDQHGPVKYIVLPATAPEHAALAGDFARAFPSAEFYATDKQYSDLGFPRKPKPLPQSSQGLGLWDGEFDHEVLTVVASKTGTGANYQDAAFFHKPSRTLLVCDSILSVSPEPPAILTSEPEYIRALLFHARDNANEVVVDSPEVRRKGWARIIMFALFFAPRSVSSETGLGPLFGGPRSQMPELGYDGYLAFTWQKSWKESFDALSENGKPFVAPLVQTLMVRREDSTKRWLEQITQWNFERVVPVHCDGPLDIGPAQITDAFEFIRKGNYVRVCDEDIVALKAIDLIPGLYETSLGPLQGRKCGVA